MKWVADLWHNQHARGDERTPVWLVIDAANGNMINGAISKRAAQRLLTSQNRHAYLCRLLPPNAEYNLP